MKFGAPVLPLTFLPLLPTIVPSSNTPPEAFFTPGTCAAFSTSAWSNAGGFEPLSLLKSFFGDTLTSMPLDTVAKMLSNCRLIVSVRMYVPEISATPSTTAMAVRTVRSLRAAIPLREMLSITQPPS